MVSIRLDDLSTLFMLLNYLVRIAQIYTFAVAISPSIAAPEWGDSSLERETKTGSGTSIVISSKSFAFAEAPMPFFNSEPLLVLLVIQYSTICWSSMIRPQWRSAPQRTGGPGHGVLVGLFLRWTECDSDIWTMCVLDGRHRASIVLCHGPTHGSNAGCRK